MNLSDIARGAFLTQFQSTQALLPGCIEGKDPIHLHDLRVANRRTRAALIEFKFLLPENIIQDYQESFRWIHHVASEVRDLDVGLAYFSEYQRKIPKAWQMHLDPLKTLLSEKRKIAQVELVKNLESDRLQKIFAGWAVMLEGDTLDKSSLSMEPAREFGCRRIIKRFQSVRRRGKKLTKKTPANDYHNYRITIKKLRYLMEFFRPALDSDQFAAIRTKLKTVQDAFGAFQDAEIQLAKVSLLAEELYQQGGSYKTMLALGQLVGILEKKWRQSKKACLVQVRWITEDATARSFQSCFQYPVDR
ncbi:MAG: CHAD domain-containing protein [Anaerolineales bacterium]|nr:CHAD domain-containing protein [Anaerolineales bacterium]